MDLIVPPPLANSGIKKPASCSDVDVVISTSPTSLLPFLEGWKSIIAPYHLIIVLHGDAAVSKPEVPAGFDAEVFSGADFGSKLGSGAWCLAPTKRGCQSFGVLMSTKQFVLMMDDTCLPAADPSGFVVDALQTHVHNLEQPATPYFFNTLYDPYRAGADFVRGYPFSLRDGVPTALSHGLWLSVPDYDAPTRLVKPRERNSRYVDSVLTVPRGVMYSMSSINLSFNRELIGVAMYFAEAGHGQEDIWAGWCSKVIADHLGYGCKTGLPYVTHESPNTALENMQKDSSKAFSQESVIPFFNNVKLSPASGTAEDCYLELASKVRAELGAADESFIKLADSMVAWVSCWKAAQAEK